MGIARRKKWMFPVKTELKSSWGLFFSEIGL